jgi:hypothetical protein
MSLAICRDAMNYWLSNADIFLLIRKKISRHQQNIHVAAQANAMSHIALLFLSQYIQKLISAHIYLFISCSSSLAIILVFTRHLVEPIVVYQVAMCD